MTYNLIIAPDAVKDIEKAFDYYSRFSRTAIDTFDKELLQVFDILETNPFFFKSDIKNYVPYLSDHSLIWYFFNCTIKTKQYIFILFSIRF